MSLLAALLLQGVGEPAYEDPLKRVIQYLARHQNENGSWGEAPPDCRCPTTIPSELHLPIVPDDETIRCFEYLCDNLQSDLPSERERLEKDLIRLGLPVFPLLQESGTQPDLEVRWRCRQALHDLWHRNPFVRAASRQTAFPAMDDLELKATGLALLALSGGGYTHFSLDQLLDPMRPEGCHRVGQCLKKGLAWLMERQRPDGSFGASSAEGNIYPALALVEAYGLTNALVWKESALKAAEFVAGLKSEAPLVRLWKQFVLESARLAEFPVPERRLEDLIQTFQGGTSTTSLSATVLLSSFAKRPADAARARLLGMPSESWTVEERFYGLLTVNRVWKVHTDERRYWMDHNPSEWRKQQIVALQCDRGSWPEADGRFEPRLMATLWTTLAYEQYYAYSFALLATP